MIIALPVLTITTIGDLAVKESLHVCGQARAASRLRARQRQHATDVAITEYGPVGRSYLCPPPHPAGAPAFRPSTKTRYRVPCHSPAPSYPARRGQHVRITPPATGTSRPAIFPTTATVYAHSPDRPASPCSRAGRRTTDAERESSRTPLPSTRPRPCRTSPPHHRQQPHPQPEDVRMTEKVLAAVNGRAAKACERPKATGQPADTRKTSAPTTTACRHLSSAPSEHPYAWHPSTRCPWPNRSTSPYATGRQKQTRHSRSNRPRHTAVSCRQPALHHSPRPSFAEGIR